MKNICPAHLKIYEIVVRLTFYSCSITFLHNDCAIIYILYTYIYIQHAELQVFAKRVLFTFLGNLYEFIYPPSTLNANKNPQRPRVALIAANEIRSSNYNGSTRRWKIFDRAI